MAEQSVTLFKLDINVDAAIKDSAKLQTNIDELKNNIKELKKAEGDNSEAIAEQTAQLKAQQKELNENNNLTKNTITANKAATGSIKQMRSELSVVSIEWAKLSKEERLNSDRGKELTKQKANLTEALKKEEGATGDARRNVGNYSRGIQDAVGNMTSFIPVMGKSTQATQMLGFAFKAGLGPISLLIGAISLIVSGLTSFFTSSEEGQDSLKRLQAIFDVVVGNIVDLMSAFGKALMNPMQALEDMRAFFDNTLGNIISGIVEGAFARMGVAFRTLGLAWEKLKGNFVDNADGIAEAQAGLEQSQAKVTESDNKLRKGLENTVAVYSDVKNAVVELVAEQEKEIQIATRLADQQAALDKQIRSATVQNAKDQAVIADLRNKAAQKEKFTNEERLAFLDEAILKENEVLKRNEDIAEQKLQIRKEQNALSNSTKEDLDAVAQLEAELINLRTQNATKTRSLESQRVEAIRSAAAEEVAIQKEKESLLAEAAKIKAEQDLEAKELNAENDLALLNSSLDSRLEAERAALEIQYQEELAFAEKIGADTSKVEAKYAKAREVINKTETKAKLGLAQGFADDLAGLAGEGTATAKAAGVASATINTYQAATGAYASLSAIPVVGPALGIAAAASAVVSGLANVKKILSVKSGLPNDGGGGGGGGLSASTPSAPNVTQAITAPSVAGDIGSGIVSRDSGVIDTTNNNISQPVLVTDDVTVSQNEQFSNNQTATI